MCEFLRPGSGPVFSGQHRPSSFLILWLGVAGDYPSMSFSAGAGADGANAGPRTKTFTKHAILPTSSNPAAAQVIPRNFSPYWAETFEPLPWAFISATNSKAMTVAMMDAMLMLRDPS